MEIIENSEVGCRKQTNFCMSDNIWIIFGQHLKNNRTKFGQCIDKVLKNICIISEHYLGNILTKFG